jgi:hypothetical protein
MRLDGVDGQEQGFGDLLIRHMRRQETQHGHLAVGEQRGRLARGRPGQPAVEPVQDLPGERRAPVGRADQHRQRRPDSRAGQQERTAGVLRLRERERLRKHLGRLPGLTETAVRDGCCQQRPDAVDRRAGPRRRGQHRLDQLERGLVVLVSNQQPGLVDGSLRADHRTCRAARVGQV